MNAQASSKSREGQMSIRSIVLDLHDVDVVDALMRVGVALGQEHLTHLIGVHGIPVSIQSLSVPMYLPEDLYQKIESSNLLRADTIRVRFEQISQTIDMPTEWHLHKGHSSNAARHLLDHVLTADMVLVGQSLHDSAPWLLRELLQKSTTPMMVVPSTVDKDFQLRSIAILWTGSIQGSRAIRDSLELLKQAAQVRILCSGPAEGNRQQGQIAGADVALWLSRHGVNVVLDEHLVERLKHGDAVMKFLREQSMDMLVMGGYGHSPLYDALVGGFTDDVIANTTVPVFLSH